MANAPQIAAFILVNAIAVGAAGPQIGNLQHPVRAKRLASRAVVIFCASFIFGWILAAGHFVPEYVAGPMIFLSAITAFASWSAGMVWGGPPTPQDKQTFLFAGTAILLLLGFGALGALGAGALDG